MAPTPDMRPHTTLDHSRAAQVGFPHGASGGWPSAFRIGLEGFYWKQKGIRLGCYKLVAILSHNLEKATTFDKWEF